MTNTTEWIRIERDAALQRADHFADACLSLKAENEQLRNERQRLLHEAQGNGFTGDDVDAAISWAVRQMGEWHKLQQAVKYLRENVIQTHGKNPYVYAWQPVWEEFERRVSG